MPGAFKQTNLDGGGWVTGFASHPSGRLYMRTDVGGVYRSDDQGQKWKWLSGDMTTEASGHVQGIAVGATSPDLVFKALGTSYTASDPGRGVWRTTDGGQTWQHVLTNVNFSGNDEFRWQGECVAITPGSGDQEIFAITRGQGLWRSTSGGGPGTWFQEGGSLFDGLIGHVVHMHPAFPNEIFVAGVKGTASSALFRGVRGPTNITWTAVTVSTSTTAVTRLARLPSGVMFAAVQDGTVNRFYKSDPTATTWTDITTTVLGPHTANGPLGTCQILNDGNTILLGWLGMPTRKSTDGGNTWTSVPMQITGSRPIAMLLTETHIGWARGSVHQDPLNPNRWYLPGGYGPFLSTDAGDTASYMVQGIGEVVTWKPVWHPNDPMRVYMPVSDLICFISTDGSSTGLAQRNPRRHLPEINSNVGMTYATKALLGPVTGNNPPKTYFIGGAYFGPYAGRAGILTTDDDGLTWSLVHITGIVGSGLPAFCEIVSGTIAPDNQNEIIVAVNSSIPSECGFYRSTDGGVNFTQSTGVPSGGFWGGQFINSVSMESNPNNPNQVFAWVNNIGFLVSNNRGVSWSSVGHSPLGPGDSKLYDWNAWGFLTRDPVTGRLWFGGNVGHLGLAYSVNNGTNWTYLDAPFSNTGFEEVRAIDAYDSQIVVCARRFGDPFLKIYYSGDNGANWRECTKPGFRFPRTTYVALNRHLPGHFWVSTNGRSYARFFPGLYNEWTQIHFDEDELNTPTISDPAADPDGDGVPNVLEYALGGNPRNSLSSPTPVVGSVPFGPQERLTLTFTPQVVTGIKYYIEVSNDLVSWTTAADVTALLTPSVPFTFTDTVDLLSAPRRFALLRVELLAPDSGIARTIPVGGVEMNIFPGTNSAKVSTPLSAPLVSQAFITGRSQGFLTGVTTNTLTSVGAGWTPGALATAANPYLLRILTGSAAGHTFLIGANTADTLTLHSADALLVDLTTLGIVTSGPNPDRFQILPCDTLLSLLGTPSSTDVLGGTSAAAADTVAVFSPHLGNHTYFYHTSSGQWVRNTFGFPPANNTPIRPETGLVYQRLKSTAIRLVYLGTVPHTDRRVFVRNSGSTLVSSGWPATLQLSASQITTIPGWVSNISPSVADIVGFGMMNFFHDGTNWRRQSFGNPLANPQLPFSTSLMLNKKGTATGHSVFLQQLPYSLP